MRDELVKCENCDRNIGRLEKLFEWQGHTVCLECRRRLVADAGYEEDAPAVEPPTEAASLTEAESDSDEAIAARRDKPEETVWTGRPSQVVNLKAFALCGFVVAAIAAVLILFGHRFWSFILHMLLASLIIPVAVGLWKWLVIRCTKYEVTTERIRITTGVLSRLVDELELYRVKDTQLLKPLLLRIFALGTIEIVTSDRTTPILLIPAIRGARETREKIRRCVEERRDRKRVREVDFE